MTYPNDDDNDHHGDKGKNSTLQPSFAILKVEAHL